LFNLVRVLTSYPTLVISETKLSQDNSNPPERPRSEAC